MYIIMFADEVIKNDIPRLSKIIKVRIRKAIDERLSSDPIHFGKPLRYSLRGHRRLRVSDYRVIYRIDEEKKVVFISAIKHRKDVYE